MKSLYLRSLTLVALLMAALAFSACGADATATNTPFPAFRATPIPTGGTTAAAGSGTPAAARTTVPDGIPAASGAPTTTASGLQYIDLKVGEGAEAKAGQTATVNYIGWLTDGGKKFDSSLDPGKEPFSFKLGAGRVIKGWDEGVAGMKVGGKRRLIIPAALGYGAGGSPPVIPGNASLTFDVDLLDTK